MADFKSFREVAQEMYGEARVFRGPNGPRSKAMLNMVGEEFKKFFQNKILDGGPGWDALSSFTEEIRTRQGFAPSDPLFASGKLHDAIDFEVNTEAVGGAVHIGVRDEDHEHPFGGTIKMEDLIIILELGVSNAGRNRAVTIPPRPLFSAEDVEQFSEKTAEAFIDLCMSSITGKKSGSMFKKV